MQVERGGRRDLDASPALADKAEHGGVEQLLEALDVVGFDEHAGVQTVGLGYCRAVRVEGLVDELVIGQGGQRVQAEVEQGTKQSVVIIHG